MLDSVIKVSKKYYPQTLLEESKYKIKIKKPPRKILSMMIEIHVHLVNVIMNLIMNLTMNLIMNLTMMNLMTNLLMMNLKIKTVFKYHGFNSAWLKYAHTQLNP